MDNILQIIRESWDLLALMSPYLLFGFLVAGILHIFLSAEWVEKHLGARGFMPALKASAFGVPLPLCSCSVIPVAAGLRKQGASRGATTAFLTSTPQTGVDSIFVTYALLGPVYAIFRPIAAFVTGFISGVAAEFVDRSDEPKSEQNNTGKHEGSCCSTPSKKGGLREILNHGFVTLPRDIGSSMLVGLLLAGLIGALVPNDFFASHLGGGLTTMLVMMAAAIPVYVCSTASVPIAAALIYKGVSPGAALVFLVCGPATNAATVAMVWKLLGRRTVTVYLATVAGCALLSGLLLDWIIVSGNLMHHMHHAENISLATHISGVVLLLVLAVPGIKKLVAKMANKQPNAQKTVTSGQHQGSTVITVKGMTCMHCAEKVEKTLQGCVNVDTAKADPDSGKVEIFGGNFDANEIKTSIENAGYTVVNIAGSDECCSCGCGN